MSKTKKLSKVLALVIMLALVIGVLPMGAMASNTPVYVRFFDGASQIGSTVYVTAANDDVYSAVTAAISANTSISTNDCVVDAFGIHKIVYNNGTEDVILEPNATESNDKDSILYTVDDKLSDLAIGQNPVSAGSVITVFYAQDYQTTLYAYIVPDGAATSGNAIAANTNDTIKFRVAASTVDFNNLYVMALDAATPVTINSETEIEATTAVSGYTVVPAYKRVVNSSTSILSAWRTATTTAYNALSSTQQGTIDSNVVSAGTDANATMTQVNALAYEVAPLTRQNSKDLKRLSFTDTSNEYMDILQAATGRNGFDPNVTAYTLETATGNVTIHAAALASGASISYSSNDSHMTVNNGVISFSATGTYTLTVTITNSGTKSYTVTITYAAAATSGVPGDVCGYLPVGQFARGNGWGALYTNGTNTSGTKKGTAGYVSTGVSLGLLGGYIQYDLGANKYITDDADNPYGVDFIVYGNPFSGNPEAGAVMVSEDGKVWYNLAGSLHYDSNTVKCMNISYMKIDTDGTVITDSNSASKTFNKGIWYSTDYVPTDLSTDFNDKIVAANWTQFLTATAWWPEYSTESYGNVWADTHLGDHTDSNTTGDVYWNRTNTAHEVITYLGVTRVKDDAELSLTGANATDYYRFGYADVREIGSHYGKAINPYATAPSAGKQTAADGTTNCGGDGFDLAWAVDDSGNPVNMSSKHIRFIRVYSAVLYNAGIFGETSAEVCGLYIATGTGSGAYANAPTVKINGSTISTTNGGVAEKRLYSGTSATINVTSSADHIFVNGELVSSGNNYVLSIASGNTYYVQIITQNGTESPYLTVLKIVR